MTCASGSRHFPAPKEYLIVAFPRIVDKIMALSHGSSRRAFLAGVVGLPLVAGGCAVSAAEAAQRAAPALDGYVPDYFSTVEWRFVLAACDRLIPADEVGPGALEANVPIFIDQELAGTYGQAVDWYMQGPFDATAPGALGYQLPYTPQEIYRRGIKAVDAHCTRVHGVPFAELDASARDAVLTDLQGNAIDLATYDEPMLTAPVFFDFLRSNAQEGYLADPMYGGNKGMGAWLMIGFPGARASFLEWVGQHDVTYPLGPVSILGERR